MEKFKPTNGGPLTKSYQTRCSTGVRMQDVGNP